MMNFMADALFFNTSMDVIHEPTKMFDTIGTGITVIMFAIIGVIIIIIAYKILTGRE
jgi:hypothetical protein